MFESFILAGGESSRMGRDKRFLKLGNKTLLERSIYVLQELESKKVSIVVAKDSAELPDFRVLKDIYKDRGTLGGIHTALARCQEKFTLITACDYPFISTELLDYLLKTAQTADNDCVVPIQKDGIIQPLCGVYNTGKCFEILTAILENPDKTPSARDFVKRLNSKLIEFNEIESLPNANYFFFNLNTPEDLKKARQINMQL